MDDIEKEFYSVLTAFDQHHVLCHLVLIGSWALKIYEAHFTTKHLPFKTTDVDFSVKNPRQLSLKVSPSIHEILLAKGYTPEFSPNSRAEKYIPRPEFGANQLDIDFLCEYGRHIREPYTIKGLGIKATPISFQNVLLENISSLKYRELFVNVPEPSYWAAHKIAISQRREGSHAQIKMIKDLEGAGIIVDAIGEENVIKAANNYPGKFRKLFEKGLEIYKSRFGNNLPYL